MEQPERIPISTAKQWNRFVSKFKHSRWTLLAPLGLIVLASFSGNIVRAFCLIGAVIISIWIVYDTEFAKGTETARHSRKKHIGRTAIASLVLIIAAVGILWLSNRIEAFAQNWGKVGTTQTGDAKVVTTHSDNASQTQTDSTKQMAAEVSTAAQPTSQVTTPNSTAPQASKSAPPSKLHPWKAKTIPPPPIPPYGFSNTSSVPPDDGRPCNVDNVTITGYGNNGVGMEVGNLKVCNIRLNPGEYTPQSNQPNSGVSTPPIGSNDTHSHIVEVTVGADSDLTQAQANDLVLEAIRQFVAANKRMPKNDELRQRLKGMWVNIDCETHGTGILNSGASTFENVTIEQTSCDTGVNNSANGANFKGLHITISNGIVTPNN